MRGGQEIYIFALLIHSFLNKREKSAAPFTLCLIALIILLIAITIFLLDLFNDYVQKIIIPLFARYEKSVLDKV